MAVGWTLVVPTATATRNFLVAVAAAASALERFKVNRPTKISSGGYCISRTPISPPVFSILNVRFRIVNDQSCDNSDFNFCIDSLHSGENYTDLDLRCTLKATAFAGFVAGIGNKGFDTGIPKDPHLAEIPARGEGKIPFNADRVRFLAGISSLCAMPCYVDTTSLQGALDHTSKDFREDLKKLQPHLLVNGDKFLFFNIADFPVGETETEQRNIIGAKIEPDLVNLYHPKIASLGSKPEMFKEVEKSSEDIFSRKPTMIRCDNVSAASISMFTHLGASILKSPKSKRNEIVPRYPCQPLWNIRQLSGDRKVFKRQPTEPNIFVTKDAGVFYTALGVDENSRLNVEDIVVYPYVAVHDKNIHRALPIRASEVSSPGDHTYLVPPPDPDLCSVVPALRSGIPNDNLVGNTYAAPATAKHLEDLYLKLLRREVWKVHTKGDNWEKLPDEKQALYLTSIFLRDFNLEYNGLKKIEEWVRYYRRLRTLLKDKPILESHPQDCSDLFFRCYTMQNAVSPVRFTILDGLERIACTLLALFRKVPPFDRQALIDQRYSSLYVSNLRPEPTLSTVGETTIRSVLYCIHGSEHIEKLGEDSLMGKSISEPLRDISRYHQNLTQKGDEISVSQVIFDHYVHLGQSEEALAEFTLEESEYLGQEGKKKKRVVDNKKPLIKSLENTLMDLSHTKENSVESIFVASILSHMTPTERNQPSKDNSTMSNDNAIKNHDEQATLVWVKKFVKDCFPKGRFAANLKKKPSRDLVTLAAILVFPVTCCHALQGSAIESMKGAFDIISGSNTPLFRHRFFTPDGRCFYNPSHEGSQVVTYYRRIDPKPLGNAGLKQPVSCGTSFLVSLLRFVYR